MDTQHLLEDRKLMMRKLHLADLRLTARDAELEYLHETLRAYNAHAANHDPPLSRQSPTLQKQFRKGPPYLFQQQYSPKIRSDLRPPSQQSQWISGLDSLGILADQMLSNPDFEKAGDPETLPASPTTTTTNWRIPTEPSHLDLKRSKRSIDSANTLVAMPSFVITPLDDQQPTPYNRLDIRESPNSSHFATKKARLLDSSWTADDDVALRKTVEALGTNQWEKVAAAIPTKTLQQCRQRWSGLYGQPSEDPTTSRPFNARHTPSIAALLDSNEDLQMRQSTYSFHLNSPTYCQSPPQTDIQERP
ncbi:hypothetical protein CLU79DRAFT_775485 [Phycomyces nitens]|nr:hypothetical protein CLU79DRAFT_775485 [Phycomyces nitens]